VQQGAQDIPNRNPKIKRPDSENKVGNLRRHRIQCNLFLGSSGFARRWHLFDAVWLQAAGSVLATTIAPALIVRRILQPPFLLRKGGPGGRGMTEDSQAALSVKDKTRIHSSTGP
jgi:hypothetical protein